MGTWHGKESTLRSNDKRLLILEEDNEEMRGTWEVAESPARSRYLLDESGET